MKTVFTILLSVLSWQVGAQEIAGTLIDKQKQTLVNIVVMAIQNGVVKGGNVTNYDGIYSIRPLDPGHYDLMFLSVGYDTLMVKDVVVLPGTRTTQNGVMKESKIVFDRMTYHQGYRGPKIQPRPMASAGISGVVLDEKNRPVAHSIVRVYQDSILCGEEQADADGGYAVLLERPGQYDVLFTSDRLDSMYITNVWAREDKLTTLNAILFRPRRHIEDMNIICTNCFTFRNDFDNPDTYIYTREDIVNMPW